MVYDNNNNFQEKISYSSSGTYLLIFSAVAHYLATVVMESISEFERFFYN